MDGENPKMNSCRALESVGLNHLAIKCTATAINAIPNIAAAETVKLGDRLCASGSKSLVAVNRKKPDAKARKTASASGGGKIASANKPPRTGARASTMRKTKSLRDAGSPWAV